MDPARRFQLSNSILFLATLSHALLTWPLRPAVGLFVGGTALAFGLEAIGTNSGLLRHNARPQVLSVPVSIPFVWPAIVYVFYRTSLLVTPVEVRAAALAALSATVFDAITDPIMLGRGLWAYPESRLSRPRFRGVPWWNFVAWFGVVFVTALVPGFFAA